MSGILVPVSVTPNPSSSMTTMMVLPASSVEDLVARTGGDGDGGGAVPLDGKSHDDHMVHPASAGVEDNLASCSCLPHPKSFMAASMKMVMA